MRYRLLTLPVRKGSEPMTDPRRGSKSPDETGPRAPIQGRSGFLRRVGTGDEPFLAFFPNPLPPDPPLDIGERTEVLLDRANQALGRLDGVSLLLPNPDTFIYAYVRKEAVLSSQIEGTQSSLSDLLISEQGAVPGAPAEDVALVSNYVAAMNHGLTRIEGGFPLSLRLIREMHRILLLGARGSDQDPGEFRRTQNWIGGTRPGNARFVPPPANEVLPAMGALEKFLHDDPVATRPLVKAALAHGQFETIHPFLDGNGRMGRLLITLLLCSENVLRSPLLYLSVYLKRHRDQYYEHLQRIRIDGDWESWIVFFLEAVISVADEATTTTRQIVGIIEEDRRKVAGLGRAAGTALALHDYVARSVFVSVPTAARELGISDPPIYSAVRKLQELGILVEVTGQQRNRIFAYDKYLETLVRDAGG
jgi:Fic family protein